MAGIATPALVLDLDVFEANVATAFRLARSAGIALRPHAKSHKCVEIAAAYARAGAVGACVATVAEAEALSGAGVAGVLLTAPTAADEQLDRVAAIRARGGDLSVVVDHPDIVAALSRRCAAAGVTLRTLVDCDVGTGRTGVLSADGAVAVARAIAAAPGLQFSGVQAYWGHLQQVRDVGERRAGVEEQAGRLRHIVGALAAAGLAPGIVTGGGTGTFAIDRTLGLFTELQIGSFAFLDSLYGPLGIEADGSNPFRHSLFVRAAVVSANAVGNDVPKVIVNAGLKAFATDSGLPRLAAAPRDLATDAVTFRFMGDEHGALMLPPGSALVPGDEVELVPSHCDPTVNLYSRYHLRRAGAWAGTWRIVGRYGDAA
jgi:3-hydroxy-D-aspartate aldolase